MAQHISSRSTLIAPQPVRMTEQEFQAWMAEEDVRAEWVDGEVIAFMPPTLRHQQLIMFLGTLLHIFAISKQLGSVVVAPYAMRLRSGRSYREPDIVFVSTHNHARLDQARLEGPADIAIEIVSDDSVARDRLQKFSEYAASGIREYWIIDPRDGQCDARASALVDGSYSQIEPDEFGRWHSHVLSGLWIDPAWLFAEELPNPISVLERPAIGKRVLTTGEKRTGKSGSEPGYLDSLICIGPDQRSPIAGRS